MTVLDQALALLRQRGRVSYRALKRQFQQLDARARFMSIDRERLGGVPCFVGTRVPIKYLWEYLIKGKTLEAFLDDFEGVPREEAIAVMEQAYERLLKGLPRL